MTTWDRQDKPLAREFQEFLTGRGALDLTGIIARSGRYCHCHS